MTQGGKAGSREEDPPQWSTDLISSSSSPRYYQWLLSFIHSLFSLHILIHISGNQWLFMLLNKASINDDKIWHKCN